MKRNVYVTFPIPPEIEKYLENNCTVRKWAGDDPIPRSVLLEEVATIEGLYTNGMGVQIDAELLEHAPELKVVSNVSVGYNNFDVEALEKYDVIGTNTPFVLDESVADLAFALVLGTARRIAELDQFVKEGRWERTKDDQPFYGIDVHSKKLGIIGMGRIGEAIARRAKLGFNMDVLYHNRRRKRAAEQKYAASYHDLQTLLQRSDYVVLATPLTDETYQLIGKRELQLMKKSAILINISRGQVVDEQALIEALQTGEIYGAGLDVFENEPIEKTNPLLTMKNVITVPHIGSSTAATQLAMMKRAADNIIAVLNGDAPIDSVN